MPEIRSVVSTSLKDFHIVLYNTKYIRQYPTFDICLPFFKRALAHLWKEIDDRGCRGH